MWAQTTAIDNILLANTSDFFLCTCIYAGLVIRANPLQFVYCLCICTLSIFFKLLLINYVQSVVTITTAWCSILLKTSEDNFIYWNLLKLVLFIETSFGLPIALSWKCGVNNNGRVFIQFCPRPSFILSQREVGFIQEIISRLFQAHCRRPVTELAPQTHILCLCVCLS